MYYLLLDWGLTLTSVYESTSDISARSSAWLGLKSPRHVLQIGLSIARLVTVLKCPHSEKIYCDVMLAVVIPSLVVAMSA